MSERHFPYSSVMRFRPGSERTNLSSRLKEEPRIENFILPTPVEEFSSPIPVFNRGEIPPHELMAQVGKYVNLRGHSPNYSEFMIGNQCQLVLISQPDVSTPSLAVQMHRGYLTAREYVPADKQKELLQIVQTEYPDFYQNMVTKMKPDDPEEIIGSRDVDWDAVLTLDLYNEAFHVLTQVIDRAPSGTIRAEFNHCSSDGKTLSLKSNFFRCHQIQFHGQNAIYVYAELTNDFDDRSIKPSFIFLEDDVLFEEGELARLLKDASYPPGIGLPGDDVREEKYLRNRIRREWQDILYAVRHRDGSKWEMENGIQTYKVDQPPKYILRGFGQNLPVSFQEFRSIRIFDGSYNKPTVRTEEEILERMFMTLDEEREEERKEKELQEWWINKILPSCREWTKEQAEKGAEFIKANRREPIDLIREKLKGDTRLATVGMFLHPLQDDLVFRIMREIPDLDFVAVETRETSDTPRGFKENREGLAKIEVQRGIFIETSHEEAKKKYPDKYKDPDQPNEAYEVVVAAAKELGLDVLRVVEGDLWTGLNKTMADKVVSYMSQNPQKKGVYFASLLSSLYWPGYNNEDEYRKIGFSRPFVSAQSLAAAHYSDTRIRMAAYSLKEAFPGQIYSIAQFVMPKGFGIEWRNFRQSVNASRFKNRFALGNIKDTIFDNQRYLSILLPELESWPEEELWQVLGPYCTPVDINWGDLLDGVIVYPSDKKLPKPPSQEELMRVASGIILDTINQNGMGEI